MKVLPSSFHLNGHTQGASSTLWEATGKGRIQDLHLKLVQFLTNHAAAKTVTHYDMVVSLAELPFAPTRPTTTQITADWITITWKHGGGPQVDSYTLYYRAKSSSQWIVIKDIRGRTSMSLKELQPYTTYQFRLFALNDLGTSKPSPLAEFKTSPKGLYFRRSRLTTHHN